MIPAGGRRGLFTARVSTGLHLFIYFFSPAELLRVRSQPARMFQSQEHLVSRAVEGAAAAVAGGEGEIYDGARYALWDGGSGELRQ